MAVERTCDQRTPTGVWLRMNGWLRQFAWIVIGAASFYVAYAFTHGGFLVLLYLFALIQLARSDSARKAFYSGLAVGLLNAAIWLGFFWRIFGPGATALWLVCAFWIGLFVVLSRALWLRSGCAEPNDYRRFGKGSRLSWLLLPFLWCGLEYFRSELYYLRFAWLSPGFAFGLAPADVPLSLLGTYGVGFVLAFVATAAVVLWAQSRFRGAAMLLGGAATIWATALIIPAGLSSRAASLRMAGIQMEFPSEKEVLLRLNELVRKHPDSELIVLSEYTFTDALPESMKRWARDNRRFLIVGAKDPVQADNFFDTAFVVSPHGEVVFRQAKSVPIQFFKDGLAAREQKLWDSPWGKLGICICYDLSYSRVTDRLVRAGAQALIVPTMDVADWGRAEHELHGRVAPVRGAEYGIPIFRVASSGISQAVDASGAVLASTPFPGDGAVLLGELKLRTRGNLPVDRWLAPVSVVITGVVILALCRRGLKSRQLQLTDGPGPTRQVDDKPEAAAQQI
jgi:apolipoprotein N-acyltransferase